MLQLGDTARDAPTRVPQSKAYTRFGPMQRLDRYSTTGQHQPIGRQITTQVSESSLITTNRQLPLLRLYYDDQVSSPSPRTRRASMMKRRLKTIKNCGLKVTEVNLIARTAAMCNAGFELYRSGFMIPPGRPR